MQGMLPTHLNRKVRSLMGQISVDLSARVQDLKTRTRSGERKGLSFPRYFTARLEPGRTPYDECRWKSHRQHRQR